MKKLWVVLPVLISLVVVLAPDTVSAGGIIEPLISDKCECPTSAPDWGCALETVQNAMNLAIALGVIIATLVIAYAGSLWVLSPLNPSNREKGRTMLLNAVIGLAIVLSAWLFVDFLMKAIYDPGKGQFGPWEDILVADDDKDYCIQPNQQRSGQSQQTGTVGTSTATSTQTTTSTSTATSTPADPSSCPEPTVYVNTSAVVSNNAKNVLKEILRSQCLTQATITSGRRTPEDQARIMYNNLETYGVQHQKNLYGSAGDQVIDVYAAGKAAGNSQTQIRAAMTQKINDVGPTNVSKHISTTQDVFDVAPSSVSDQTKFRTALEAARSAGKVTNLIFPPTDPAYHIEMPLQ